MILAQPLCSTPTMILPQPFAASLLRRADRRCHSPHHSCAVPTHSLTGTPSTGFRLSSCLPRTARTSWAQLPSRSKTATILTKVRNTKPPNEVVPKLGGGMVEVTKFGEDSSGCFSTLTHLEESSIADLRFRPLVPRGKNCTAHHACRAKKVAPLFCGVRAHGVRTCAHGDPLGH